MSRDSSCVVGIRQILVATRRFAAPNTSRTYARTCSGILNAMGSTSVPLRAVVPWSLDLGLMFVHESLRAAPRLDAGKKKGLGGFFLGGSHKKETPFSLLRP